MSPIPRQDWFFKLNFQNSISQNTGKCELDGFLLTQSQILATYNGYMIVLN